VAVCCSNKPYRSPVVVKLAIKPKEKTMNFLLKPMIAFALATLALVGCADAPVQQKDPYNPADEQRSRAEQAQDELSSETSGN
jgi:hypothetical protein